MNEEIGISIPGIHRTAVVEKGAEIGKDVLIGPYSIVNRNVVLEDNVVVKAHVYLDGHTKVGKGTVIWPGAVIGTKTQDLKFKGEKTFVIIGSDCQIREYVTINASCGEGTSVSVGNNCLIMAYCHVAHNTQVGNNVIMSNNATLAGHVTVEDYAIIGGLTAVHQFTRVGCHAMIGGMSRVTHDVLPYAIGAGIPFRLGGLNQIGLRRRGFSFAARKALSSAFRLIYRSGITLKQAISRIESEVELLPEVVHVVDFCRSSQRGLIADARARNAELKEESVE
jgi:UDP-N-acetylglucosamine acyltransferase